MTRQFKKGWQGITILLTVAGLAAAQGMVGGQGMAGPQPGNTPPPGAINYVEGNVFLNGEPLTPNSVGQAVIAPNQTLNTQQGYAEVLLTPGAFLRLGTGSELRVAAAGLADTRLNLTRGTALIEADQFIKGTNLGIAVNGATVQIEEKGLYSINADQQAVKVLDGKARVEAVGGEKTLRKGSEVLLSSDKPLKGRDFDKKAAEAEPLYVWSEARSRSEEEADINLADRFAGSGESYGTGWYWNPYWSSYAFLPAYGYLGSPFGWGFNYFGGYGFGGPYFGRGYNGGYGRVAGVAGFHASIGGGFHGGGRR